MITKALRRIWHVAMFAGYYAGMLVRANLVVAWEVVRPTPGLAPGVVAVPLRSRTQGEIAAISNLISLTPGTLTLGVQNDPPLLYVHGMHAADRERFRGQLRDLEDRMLAAFGRLGRDKGDQRD